MGRSKGKWNVKWPSRSGGQIQGRTRKVLIDADGSVVEHEAIDFVEY